MIKDDEYEMEQHYGHSGITMWKENMKWSAWLQDVAIITTFGPNTLESFQIFTEEV